MESENGTSVVQVALPDKHDFDALRVFTDNLSESKERYGELSLKQRLNKYIRHTELAEYFWKQSQKALNSVNGVRTERTVKARVKAEDAVRQVYMRLGSMALRDECRGLGLDYEAFETVDERINAMVEASLR